MLTKKLRNYSKIFGKIQRYISTDHFTVDAILSFIPAFQKILILLFSLLCEI